MTIGSPEILTKRKKEKKQRTSAGHHFLNHPKNEFSMYRIYNFSWYIQQIAGDEIHELFYKLDQNCGVGTQSGQLSYFVCIDQ